MIRDYKLRERIGAGGFAVVYRAWQAAVEREVAVKVILPEYADQPGFETRFEAEAKMVARLEHPYIVPLHDYWRDESGAYLVMRWLKGGSLREYLDAGPTGLRDLARLLEQIGSALAFAHSRGVIHRDLKPENILLDEDENAYLTDFGIAKDLGKSRDLEAGKFVGTVDYLSPEQAVGEPVTPQSDIYLLGVLLYELLTCEHPFPDSTPFQLIQKHLGESLPSVADKRQDLSPWIDEIIRRATAKVPTDRYPNVETLLADLRREMIAPEQWMMHQKVPVFLARERDRRDQLVLLNRVKEFWIEGVLRKSLHGSMLIELGIEEQPGDIDHPWEMVLETFDQKEPRTLPPRTRIVDVFNAMDHNLLILGAPGSGKTITLLELARDAISSAEVDATQSIPVKFNLSSWRAGQSLAAWLVQELNFKYRIPRKVGRKWIEASDLLLLLDGLDEVKREHRNACAEAINNFREEHGLTELVVCCRTEEYRELAGRLKLDGAILLQPLTSQQIDDYLAAAGSRLAALRRFVQSDAGLQELAQSPLMLSVMSLAYRDVPLETLRLQVAESSKDHRRRLFDVYIERIFGRSRKDRQVFTRQQTLRWLKWLAQGMIHHDKTVFLIEQFQPSWLPTRQQRWFYALGSRLVSGLGVGLSVGLAIGLRGGLGGGLIVRPNAVVGGLTGGLLVGVIAGIIDGIRFERSTGSVAEEIGSTQRSASSVLFLVLISGLIGLVLGAQFGAQIVGLIGGMLIGLIVGLKSFRQHITDDIQTAETLALSRRGLLIGAAIGGIGGLVGGIIVGLIAGLEGGPSDLLIFGTCGGLIGAMLGALSREVVETKSFPNQGIQLSSRNAISAGMIGGWLVGLIGGLTTWQMGRTGGLLISSLTGGLSGGLSVGLLAALWYGAFDVIRHYTMRLIIRVKRLAPWNYARFLDYAVELIFLRKVGGGYIFIHRMLLEHFAEGKLE